jgi:DNA-binding XRE family transcriptional regulator
LLEVCLICGCVIRREFHRVEFSSTTNFYFVENSFQALRKAAGLTLKEAEAMAGYSVATISALENDNRGSDRLKQKLLEIYGQSTGELREPAPAYRVAAPPPAQPARHHLKPSC